MTKKNSISTQRTWRMHTEPLSGQYLVSIVPSPTVKKKKAPDKSKTKADAIYTYLKAVRTLGKRRISSSDVAVALDLSEVEVRKIMSSMEDRGVRAS